MPFKQSRYLNTTRIAANFLLLSAGISIIVLIIRTAGFVPQNPPGSGILLYKINTIIAVLLACLAHGIFSSGKRMLLAKALSVIVILLGAVTLAQYILGINLRIDEIIMTDGIAQPPYKPGRMSPAAATGLVLIGAALILNVTESYRRKQVADAFVSIVAIASFLVCTGKLLDAEFYGPVKVFSRFSFVTALSLLFLSLSVLFSRPRTGLLSPFYESSWASRIATRQFLFIMGILIFFGWLCNAGSKMGLYNPQLGTTIMIALFIISIFFIIRSGIIKLTSSERERSMLHGENEKKAALLKDVFERIKDPFVALDRNWCFTYVNEKAGVLIRRNPETLIGKNIWEEFPAMKSTGTFHAFTRAMHDQQITTVLDYYAPLDMWHEDIIYPSPEGLSVFVHDITEKKMAERKLEESENRYRTLMQEAGDLIIVFDKKGQLLDANESSLQALGYDEGDFRKMNLVDFVFEDDLVKAPFGFDLLDMGVPTITHRRLRRKDGSALEVEIHAKKLSDNRYLSVARDLTERLRAERKLVEKDTQLREISSAIPGFMYQFLMTADGQFHFNFVSDSVLDIANITPEEIYADPEKAFSRVHPADLPGLFKSINISAESGQPWRFVFRTVLADQAVRWFRGNSSVPQKWQDGSLVWNGVIFDITELKTAEAKLASSYQAIRELTEHIQNVREEERTAIAREIHDELGQQLTVMMIDMAWIDRRAGAGNEAVHDKINSVFLMMDEMLRSVRRISAALRPSMLDDLGILAAIEMHLSEFEKRFGIHTRLVTPENEPLLSPAIKNGLYRIFQESLTNVARHSGAKNVTVHFKIAEQHIHFSIRDDGKGFEESVLTKKKTLGVLGMKERAAMMGGEYEISGQPGRGTTVHVHIPLLKDTAGTTSLPG